MISIVAAYWGGPTETQVGNAVWPLNSRDGMTV